MDNIRNRLQEIIARITTRVTVWVKNLSRRARIALGSVAAVIVIAVLALMVQFSEPGDLLYGVKTSIEEHVVGLFQVTEEQQFNYGIGLLEERFAEVQKLARANELTDARMEALDPQFRTQVEKIDELLNDENTPFDAKKIFDTTNHMVALVRATDQVMDDSTERGSTEEFDEIEELAESVHERQIERIVANTSNEEMITLIQQQLELITERSQNQNRDTQTDVRELLFDTSRALSQQNFADAFEHVGEAVQLLEVRTLTGLTQG